MNSLSLSLEGLRPSHLFPFFYVRRVCDSEALRQSPRRICLSWVIVWTLFIVHTMISPFIPTTATLSHLQDDPIYDEERPYEIWADNVSADIQRTNVKLNIVPDCALTDIRTMGSGTPTLGTFGFQWLYQDFPYQTGLHSADYIDLPREKQLDTLEKYLNEMSGFLEERLGCVKVVCWDWRVCIQSLRPFDYKLTETTNRSELRNWQNLARHRTSTAWNRKKERMFVVSRSTVHTLSTQASGIWKPIFEIADWVADGSPEWMQKVVSKVVTAEEASWAENGKFRTRVLTYQPSATRQISHWLLIASGDLWSMLLRQIHWSAVIFEPSQMQISTSCRRLWMILLKRVCIWSGEQSISGIGWAIKLGMMYLSWLYGIRESLLTRPVRLYITSDARGKLIDFSGCSPCCDGPPWAPTKCQASWEHRTSICCVEWRIKRLLSHESLVGSFVFVNCQVFAKLMKCFWYSMFLWPSCSNWIAPSWPLCKSGSLWITPATPRCTRSFFYLSLIPHPVVL